MLKWVTTSKVPGVAFPQSSIAAEIHERSPVGSEVDHLPLSSGAETLSYLFPTTAILHDNVEDDLYIDSKDLVKVGIGRLDWKTDRGSDPVSQSKGSKIYNRTIWLTEQTEREQKLRAGAEKLLRAASSKRIQSEIAIELRAVNANLQAMREEMADIISDNANTPDIHQSKRTSTKQLLSTIPFSMKETNFVDYYLELKEFITRHYHEDVDQYRFDLNCLTDMRKACCQPISGEDGLETLFTYYNQLYFVDRRFFPSNTNGPVSFHWYDSFTGLPSTQKTVGFEKGSILFNIGILYAQKASRVKWKDLADIEEAAETFQRSAGVFQYLHDNFLHAPSIDMQLPSTLLLIQLTLAQAFECQLERHLALQDSSHFNVASRVELAQEASGVASVYSKALMMMSSAALGDNVPPLWIPLVTCKQQYHRALAHYYLATALTIATATEAAQCTGAYVRAAEGVQTDSSVYSDGLADDDEGRKTLAKAHLRQSILAFEEAMRIVTKHHTLTTFHQKLKFSHDRSLAKFSVLEEEEDFTELLTAPEILPKLTNQLQPILPDFSKYKVEDLFHRLGCIAIFSARHSWTVPRKVTLTKKDGQEFGFSIRGDSPVIVATVDNGSLAEKSGMLVGDFIVAVGGIDIKWTKHDKVVTMIKSCGDFAGLHVVTPIDHNYIDPSRPPPGGMSQMTSESTLQEPAQERPKELTQDRTDKIKGRPSSASWKLRPHSSRTKEMGNDNSGYSPFSS